MEFNTGFALTISAGVLIASFAFTSLPLHLSFKEGEPSKSPNQRDILWERYYSPTFLTDNLEKKHKMKNNSKLNVILATIGSTGYVNPFITLGKALLERGNQVTLVTNAHFESKIIEAGLEFIAVGSKDDYDRITRNPDLWAVKNNWQCLLLPIFSPL